MVTFALILCPSAAEEEKACYKQQLANLFPRVFRVVQQQTKHAAWSLKPTSLSQVDESKRFPVRRLGLQR